MELWMHKISKIKNNDFLIDIDECKTNNGGCEQKCVNEPGVWYCDCHEGYEEGEDPSTCASMLIQKIYNFHKFLT